MQCYTCIITVCKFILLFIPTLPYSPEPVITAMFSGATPTIGESYSLTCTATGADQLNPTIIYQWFKDNTVVSDETQSTLSFSSLSLSNTGQYRCDVTVSSTLLHRKIFNSSYPYQLVIPSKCTLILCTLTVTDV